MSLFGNPWVAGHSGVSRFPGLSTSTHRYRPPRQRPIPRDRLIRMEPPIPLPSPIKEGVKTFLGTSTKRKMARRTRTKRSSRRRKIYRRKRRTAQPYTMTKTFKSVIYKLLDPGNGTLAASILKLNSGFDPSGDVGGQQPLAWDQYTALYNKYAVAKWGVKIEYASTDNTNPLVVGFTPTTKSTALSAYAHYKECPGTISGIVTPDIDKFQLYTKGRVKPYLMPAGGKLLSDEECTALISTDPSKILYGHLWAQEIGASADPAHIHMVVTVYQTVVFFDPVIPARS